MCDKCKEKIKYGTGEELWKQAEVLLKLAKPKGQVEGHGMHFDVDVDDLDPEELVYFIGRAIAEVVEIGTQLMVKLTNGEMEKMRAMETVADMIARIFLERHCEHMEEKNNKMTKDEKAKFISAFIDARKGKQ